MFVWWSLSPAWACSVACSGVEALPVVVLPADGEEGVPTDAAPVVRGGGASLVHEDGAPVDTSPEELADGVTALRPREALAPGETYLLVAGEEVLATFTTGDGPADGDPGTIVDLRVEGRVSKDWRPGTSLTAMCGNMGDGVFLDAVWERTTGLYEVRAEREDGSVVSLVVTEEVARLGWETPCTNTLPGLEPDESVVIGVRSIDVTGRFGAFSDPVETSARAAGGGCATGSPHATTGGLLLTLVFGLASLRRGTAVAKRG